MQKIPEAEALAIVGELSFCEDIEDWSPMKLQRGTVVCGAGLLDESGQTKKMYVELVYRTSHKTKITKYLFTLFKRFPYGKERVYQLEVTHTPRPIKDAHRRSHEHMGDARTTGGVNWSNWGYADVLAHFSEATNVTFVPAPSHPEAFELLGDI